MPRYIDAESFSERFDMMCDAGGVLASVTEAVREMVKVLIKQEPSADVELVRHGRWMYPFYCSECTFVPYYSSDITYYYCPNCGAKMDGGAD